MEYTMMLVQNMKAKKFKKYEFKRMSSIHIKSI